MTNLTSSPNGNCDAQLSLPRSSHVRRSQRPSSMLATSTYPLLAVRHAKTQANQSSEYRSNLRRDQASLRFNKSQGGNATHSRCPSEVPFPSVRDKIAALRQPSLRAQDRISTGVPVTCRKPARPARRAWPRACRWRRRRALPRGAHCL
jgi:hypothetical protein